MPASGVYWLGADLGVFMASRYVAKAELALAERLRFLEMLLKLDMGPRTALILMIPVGFMLAVRLGLAPFAQNLLPFIWIFALGWLALAWRLFLTGHSANTATLAKLDHWLRVSVAALFVSMGAAALLTGTPIEARWLAVKLLLFGIVVVIGLLLRGVLRAWARGFALLRANTEIASANALIISAYQRSTRLAHGLWLLVALIAMLGVTKPF